YGQVAARYGVSKSLVHKLHHRWLVEGDAALEPRPRVAKNVANRTPDHIRKRILELREALEEDGHDAGADTLMVMLLREKITVSRATIWRVLRAGGKITPQP